MRIKLNTKKFLKSKRVKKWLKDCEKKLEKHFSDEKVQEKVIESLILGCPLVITKKGKVFIIK